MKLTQLTVTTLCSILLLTACESTVVTADKQPPKNALSIAQQAKKIADENLIVDTHIDVPYRLEEDYEDISQATEKGDFDYPRALKGGLNAPFMSIYIPSKLQKTGGSTALANKLIDNVEAIVKHSPHKFALAYSTKQVKDNFSKGLISLPMGMENGSPIAGDIANLQHFFNRGIRYITLAHAKTNHISDSSYDENRPAQGLTDFGKELIVEMNNIGIMVDVSHVSDQAFYQVRASLKASSLGEGKVLYPGMTVDLSIIAGEVSVLHAILRPLWRIREKALREK